MASSGNKGPAVDVTPLVQWLDSIYQERKIVDGIKFEQSNSSSGNNKLALEDEGWAHEHLTGLASAVGLSRRRFGDYFGIEDGHIIAKVDTVGIYQADEMLVHYGRESLSQLYAYDDQPEPVFASNGPKCRECRTELRQRTGGICGFCMEERI